MINISLFRCIAFSLVASIAEIAAVAGTVRLVLIEADVRNVLLLGGWNKPISYDSSQDSISPSCMHNKSRRTWMNLLLQD